VRLAAAILLLPLLAATADARAQGAARAQPVSRSFGYSAYEAETIALVTAKLAGAVDTAPEGKTIEAIGTERIEVFESRDFLPNFALFVNALHATTRGYVIERELLFKQGDAYQKRVIDESARNLRALTQLSLVLAVPLVGSAPDRVRVLIITKDVWSLRLQWDLALANAGVERLVMQPAEINIGGAHQTAGATLFYQPLSTALGAKYGWPRVAGSRVSLSASANIIVSNRTGSPEGSFGAIGASKPLYSVDSEWAASAGAQWRDEISRRYSQALLAGFGRRDTAPGDRVPEAYRSDQKQAQISVVRSFGRTYKADVAVSFEATHAKFDPGDLSAYDPALVAKYIAARLPVSDDRIYPALELRSYTSNFTSVINMESLSLQEDYRVGHFADVKVYPVSQNLGSTRTFLGVFAELGYTLPLRDGLLRVDVQNTVEASASELLQGVVAFNAYLATPRTPFGRLVYSAQMVDRYANYLNARSVIGGNNRLRGYPTSEFVGRNVVASNLELRSRPVDLFKVQLGAVAFYDVADAFDGWSDLHPQHAVGVGLRALFPQFDRIVFRADVGVPISRSSLPEGAGPVAVYVSFAQALSPVGFGPPAQSVGAVPSAR
jgi:hypothetical protein